MRRLTKLLIFVFAASATHALADNTSTPEAPSKGLAIGEATKGWLELQRAGTQSSEHRQSIQGPVMQRSYERYLKSFERPIPERFDRYEKK